PELLAGLRVQAGRPVSAEVDVDAALLDGRRRRSVTVRRVTERRLLDFKHRQVVDHLPRVALDADGEQAGAVLAGRGEPDLVAPDDRRGPALVVDGHLPDDVLRLAPR